MKINDNQKNNNIFIDDEDDYNNQNYSGLIISNNPCIIQRKTS